MRMNKLFKIGAGLISAVMVSASLGTVAFASDGVEIGDITASTTSSGDYYNVTVNYSGVDTTEVSQLTVFAYDITDILNGDETTDFDEANTPVGWIDQTVSAESGQIKFKVAKGDDATGNIAAFNEGSTILIKIGGKGITAAAKVFSFGSVEPSTVTYGDVTGEGDIDSDDAFAVLQHFAEIEFLEGDAFTAGDVDGSGELDSDDAFYILQYFAELITEFPVEG